MTGAKSILLALVILLSFSIPVLSLSSSFQAFSTTANVNLCQCGMTTDRIVVSNTGDTQLLFTVELSGSAASFVTVYPLSFSLAAGKTGELRSYISPGCNAPAGANDLVLTFRANDGEVKVLRQSISISRCPNVNVLIENISKTSLPCQETTYHFAIQNTGLVPETYDVTVVPASYARLSYGAVEIQPNATAPLDVSIAPVCEVSGDLNYTLKVLSRRARFLAETPFYLRIIPAYDYTLGAPETLTVCSGEPVSIPIQLKNQATFPNSFTVTADSSSFSADLGAGESSRSQLNLTPKAIGTSDILIHAISQKGHLVHDQHLALTTEACASVNITLGSPAPICVGEQTTVPLSIRNNGTHVQTYTVSLSLPYATTEDEISLEPGREGHLDVALAPPDGSSGKRTLSASVQSGGINAIASVPLTIIGRQECEFVAVEPQHKTVEPSSNFTLMAINRGAKQATYLIRLQGPPSLSIKERSVELSPGQSALLHFNTTNETGTFLANLTLLVSGKDTSYSYPLTLRLSYPSPLVVFLRAYWLAILIAIILLIVIIYALVALATQLKKAKVESRNRAEEEAAKSLRTAEAFEDRGANYNALVTYQGIVEGYRGTKAAREARRRMRRLDKELSAEAIAEAEAREAEKSEREAKRTAREAKKQAREAKRAVKSVKKEAPAPNLLSIVVILILLILSLAVFYASRPQKAEQNRTLNFVVEEGKSRIVNLSDYFIDPDRNILTFTADSPEGIDIEINGTLVTITPLSGFIGQAEVVFTANDGHANVSSPPIPIIVVPPQGIESRLAAFFSSYYAYILLGLVLLAAIIVGLRFFEKKEPEKRKRGRPRKN